MEPQPMNLELYFVGVALNLILISRLIDKGL